MAARLEVQNSKADIFKWLIVGVLLISGVAGNFYYEQQPLAYRLIVGIVVTLVALFIASRTEKGKNILAFAKESRIEIRKVVWPTRQESIQTTLIVFVMIVFASLIIWGLDSFLFWAIGWLTGQRG